MIFLFSWDISTYHFLILSVWVIFISNYPLILYNISNNWICFICFIKTPTKKVFSNCKKYFLIELFLKWRECLYDMLGRKRYVLDNWNWSSITTDPLSLFLAYLISLVLLKNFTFSAEKIRLKNRSKNRKRRKKRKNLKNKQTKS